jgi:hypothetical protein
MKMTAPLLAATPTTRGHIAISRRKFGIGTSFLRILDALG